MIFCISIWVFVNLMWNSVRAWGQKQDGEEIKTTVQRLHLPDDKEIKIKTTVHHLHLPDAMFGFVFTVCDEKQHRFPADEMG